MVKIIFGIISLIIVALGVICIYDARILSKKIFSYADQNKATSGIKILGFAVSLVGILIIYFNL